MNRQQLVSVFLSGLNHAAVFVTLALIQAYRILVAPLLIGGCRHTPSCSSYAAESFKRHGFVKGLRLTSVRLFRCRPGGTYGYDPVP